MNERVQLSFGNEESERLANMLDEADDEMQLDKEAQSNLMNDVDNATFSSPMSCNKKMKRMQLFEAEESENEDERKDAKEYNALSSFMTRQSLSFITQYIPTYC